jgi:hypothetical protein
MNVYLYLPFIYKLNFFFEAKIKLIVKLIVNDHVKLIVNDHVKLIVNDQLTNAIIDEDLIWPVIKSSGSNSVNKMILLYNNFVKFFFN